MHTMFERLVGRAVSVIVMVAASEGERLDLVVVYSLDK